MSCDAPSLSRRPSPLCKVTSERLFTRQSGSKGCAQSGSPALYSQQLEQREGRCWHLAERGERSSLTPIKWRLWLWRLWMEEARRRQGGGSGVWRKKSMENIRIKYSFLKIYLPSRKDEQKSEIQTYQINKLIWVERWNISASYNKTLIYSNHHSFFNIYQTLFILDRIHFSTLN